MGSRFPMYPIFWKPAVMSLVSVGSAEGSSGVELLIRFGTSLVFVDVLKAWRQPVQLSSAKASVPCALILRRRGLPAAAHCVTGDVEVGDLPNFPVPDKSTRWYGTAPHS